MSTMGPPPRPGTIAGMTNVMTINTKAWTKDDSGAAKVETTGTTSNIPCRIDKLNGAQALRYGYDVNEDVYRVLTHNRHNGSDVVLQHNQCITIDGVDYETSGGGRPEGTSGMQTVIVKLRNR